MPNLQIFQVDAFADNVFEGNPAAVVPLTLDWLLDETLQKIAAENNLSETAFFLRNARGIFELRWFTPNCEVDLCGHATLAAAYVLFNLLDFREDCIVFESRSGVLRVTQGDGLLTMDFPALALNQEPINAALAARLGVSPISQYGSMDTLLVLGSQDDVRSFDPDLGVISDYGTRCVIVTAPSVDGIDFVSRVFCPNAGIAEDPVTGSAHCVLTPYWSEITGKSKLVGQQVSKRGGILHCELRGDRVYISGKACLYLIGTIHIP
jgi:PhzF family phenazine biosynthesis protein